MKPEQEYLKGFCPAWNIVFLPTLPSKVSESFLYHWIYLPYGYARICMKTWELWCNQICLSKSRLILFWNLIVKANKVLYDKIESNLICKPVPFARILLLLLLPSVFSSHCVEYFEVYLNLSLAVICGIINRDRVNSSYSFPAHLKTNLLLKQSHLLKEDVPLNGLPIISEYIKKVNIFTSFGATHVWQYNRVPYTDHKSPSGYIKGTGL